MQVIAQNDGGGLEGLLRLLVPVVFVVIYIIGLISRSKEQSKQAPGEQPKVPPAPQQGIGPYPTHQPRQVSRPVPQQQARVPQRPRPQQPSPATVTDAYTLEKRIPRRDVSPTGTTSRTPEILASPSGMEATSSADTPASAMAGQFTNMNFDAIRTGIIMAEVLGKPLSLREGMEMLA